MATSSSKRKPGEQRENKRERRVKERG